MELVLNKVNNLVSKRFFVIACLSLVTIMSWVFLFNGAGMEKSNGMVCDFMLQTKWTLGYTWIMFVMWWVMMVAMMLPSALPMILIFNTLNKKMGDNKVATVLIFAAAYLIVWGLFSVVATALQWFLVQYDLLATMGPINHKYFSAGILIAGGLWQFTAYKNACLEKCRAPLQFLSENWKVGPKASFNIGFKHGLFCLGCCWFLMTLLFYGGVMNMYWIIGLTIFVILEKVIPNYSLFSKVTGFFLLGWGGYILII